MKVSAQYAEKHLADILSAADSGEEVEIARPDQPTYRLTVVATGTRKPKRPRILGAGVGEMLVPSGKSGRLSTRSLSERSTMAPLVSGDA